MKKRLIVTCVEKIWLISLIFVFFLVLFFFIYPFADNLVYQLSIKSAADKSLLLQNSLQIESQQALSEAKDIVAGGDITALIKNNDSSYLLALLDKEARKRGLTFLAAVNKDGINLASIPISSNYGDYVFQTTAWGRAVAKGKEMAAIGAGNIFPLILVGAEPIMENSFVQGAVFAGYLINDKYATKFKSKYLSDGYQVLFYSKKDGVLGDSFSDQPTRNFLSAYFNVGSDWIQNGLSGKIVQINGENYYVENYIFPDPEKIDGGPGGALIFLPYTAAYWYIIDSSVLFLIFLLLTFLVYFHWHRGGHRKLIITVIIILGLIIFSSTLYYSYLTSAKEVTIIKSPPYTIYNSTIKLEPDNDVIDKSAEQHIAIQVTTGGEAINAVQAEINYDPDKIKVVNIITANSFCSPDLFVEKNIDNIKGVVNIVCGIPSPGFTGPGGTIAELLVQPLQEGNFSFNFGTSTQVLANDGLGTNVLRQAVGGSYLVENFLNSGKTATSSPDILLFSPTNPNSNRWYNSRAIDIFWVPLSGYDYYYLLDNSTSTVPSGDFSTKESEVNLSVKKDGIYYFHVIAVKNGVAGPAKNYKIMIDDTPPPQPVILASETKVGVGNLVRFKFSGSDDISGLQKYFYVKIDNSILFPSGPELDIPFLEPGRHYLTLRVFDNAGNYSETTKEIDVGIN
jgi:hypothetical protein